MKLRNGPQIFGNLASGLFFQFWRFYFLRQGGFWWDSEDGPHWGRNRASLSVSVSLSVSDGLLSGLFRVDACGGWMLATCPWWTMLHRPCQKPFSPAGWQCYTLKTPAWAANLSSHLVCPAHGTHSKHMQVNTERKFGCSWPENMTRCCEMLMMLADALWEMGSTALLYPIFFPVWLLSSNLYISIFF